ncbi:MAG: IPT/TIG domain-containing protein [Myxococcales bacterium]
MRRPRIAPARLASCLASLLLVGATGCLDSVVDGSLSVDLTLTDVLPDAVPAAGGVEVTVLGTHFAEGVEVLVAGQPVSLVARRDSEQLSFLAPKGTPGIADLVVRAANGQQARWTPGLRYYADTVLFNRPGLVLDPAGEPLDLAQLDRPQLGDLDGDGLDDLVFSTAPTWEAVVFLNRESGARFVFSQRFETNSCTHQVVDANRDGQADLLLGSMLRLSDAQGRLGAPIDLPVGPEESVLAVLPGELDEHYEQRLMVLVVQADWAGCSETLKHHPTLREARLSDSGAVTVLDPVEGVELLMDQWTAEWRTQLAYQDFDRDGHADLAWIGPEARVHVRYGPTFTEEWVGTGHATGLQPAAVTAPPQLDLVIDGSVLYTNQGRVFGEQLQSAASYAAHYSPFGAKGQTVWGCAAGTCVYRWLNGAQTLVGSTESAFLGMAELDGIEGGDLVLRDAGVLRARFGDSYGLSAGWPALAPGTDPETVGNWHLASGNFGALGTVAVGAGPSVAFFEVKDAARQTASVNYAAEWPANSPDEPRNGIGDAKACDLDGDGVDELVIHYRTRALKDGAMVFGAGKSGLERRASLVLNDTEDFFGQALEAGRPFDSGHCAILVWLRHLDRAELRLYRDVSGELQPVTLPAEVFKDSWSAPRMFDFDRDGRDDFFAITEDPADHHGRLEIWFSDGQGGASRHLLARLPAQLGGSYLEPWSSKVRRGLDGAAELFLVDSASPGSVASLRLTSANELEVVRQSGPVDLEDCKAMEVGDVDGDGLRDVVAWAQDGTQVKAFVARGGRFLSAASLDVHSTDTAGYLRAVVPWDLDGDHLDDLVLLTHRAIPRLGLLRNQSR